MGERWDDTADVRIYRNSLPSRSKAVALVEVRDEDAEEAEKQSIGGNAEREIPIGSAVIPLE
jgi:hypothetical protein